MPSADGMVCSGSVTGHQDGPLKTPVKKGTFAKIRSTMMQNKADIRKMIASVEDIHREAGQQLATPSRKCVVAAVITNPLAGQPDGDLDVLKDIGADISAKLVARGLLALDAGPLEIYLVIGAYVRT